MLQEQPWSRAKIGTFAQPIWSRVFQAHGCSPEEGVGCVFRNWRESWWTRRARRFVEHPPPPGFIREARVKVSAARAEQVPGVCRFQTRSTHRDPGPDATREIIGCAAAASLLAFLLKVVCVCLALCACGQPPRFSSTVVVVRSYMGLLMSRGFLRSCVCSPWESPAVLRAGRGAPSCCELSSLLIVLCAWAAQNSPYAVCPAQLQHGVRFGM